MADDFPMPEDSGELHSKVSKQVRHTRKRARKAKIATRLRKLMPPLPPLPLPPPSIQSTHDLAGDALRQAEIEGLTLQRSDRGTGFQNVQRKTYNSRLWSISNRLPYQAMMMGEDKVVKCLGHFATAEEAALCFARHQREPMTEAKINAHIESRKQEALRQAEAEGLTLPRSDITESGYKNVMTDGTRLTSRAHMWQGAMGVFLGPTHVSYSANFFHCRKHVILGRFVTAEEAALSVARAKAAMTSAPAQAAVASTPRAQGSRKRRAKSEGQEPPDMPAGARVKLEEQPPPMPPDACVKLELDV